MFRYRLIVPVGVLPQVLAYAFARGVHTGLIIHFGGEVQTDPDRFGVLLAPAGADSPTHVGGTTGEVDANAAAAMEADFASGVLPASVFWCRCDAAGQIVRTSHQPTQDRIDGGEVVLWELGTALATIGMVIHEPLGTP
jgi:hypothetical protein